MVSHRHVNIGFPGGAVVALADIERDRASRAEYLQPYHGTHDDIRCLCREEGIPIGVGRRTVPYTVFYFYPLHRSDPSRHAVGCPHRTASLAHIGTTGDRPAIDYRDGKIQVKLSSPLYRGAAVGDQGSPPEGANEANSRARSPRAGLQTLLELLWTEAELNVWRPWFTSKRVYGVIAHRIQTAAARILLNNGQELASSFFTPASYHPDREAVLMHEREAFVESLKETRGKSHYGFVLGLFRGTEERSGRNVGIRMAQLPIRLWIPRKVWQRAEVLFPNGNARSPAVLLARVARHEGKTRPWLAAEEIAILPLSDEASCIPVYTDHERELALHLVQSDRHFRRPLSCEVSAGEAQPGFILEDREDRLHLEVLGNMANPTYRAQLVEKRAAYERHQQSAWWWNTGSSKEIPVLPPPTRKNTDRATTACL